MGQFFPDNNSRLPESLKTQKLESFIRAAFDEKEIKEILGQTGKIINPNETAEIFKLKPKNS